MKRRWGGLVLALLTVPTGLVLAGCGFGPSAEDEAPGYAREAGVPRVRGKDLPALPLDRYDFSGRDHRRIQEAQARVTQRCMRSYGFEDFPLHPGRGPAMAESFNLVAIYVPPYGSLDLAHARRWGYGLDPAVLKEGRDGSRHEGRTPTDAEESVLDGTGGRNGRAEVLRGRAVPEGGCEALATRRLLQDEKNARQRYFVSERAEKLDKAVAEDHRVRRAFRDWSRCMAGKGFTWYESPAEASGDKAWHTGRKDGNTARTKKELATAVADVECNHALNTAGVWWAVSAEKQRAEVRAHKGRYEAVRAYLDRVRAIAREELG
ncbi:hypothetical protein DCW30_19190 [Streptomyces alfalfae]|uniref:hypothetical protein n=1 Tax=Streptomyces alfalfae TaxID=1642299 RepID=UPI0009A218F4|nr:hypothetical protein [Streptomyces alfalfae]AYA16792.1 hypothetical protein D3X13_11635 [Streptomyces fradiae]QUI33825.1 hypothetical protein H9W91_25390 [Streptomyces alfalfae]RXX41546.1 hypothetical protein DCW30_19190 [Streptomyces alfalfae]RZM97661.1 hypothetical protein D4104_13420 [Streptomyces alfalfae]